MPSSEETANLQLVGEVEKFPILYNHKLEGYSKRDRVDLAWESVGKAMKDTAANCREKWRNLRTVFVRKLKPGPSGTSRKNKKPYYLIDAMQFVLPFVKAQNIHETPGNVPLPPGSQTVIIASDHEEDDLNNAEHEEDTVDIERPQSAQSQHVINPQSQNVINPPNSEDLPTESPKKKKKKRAVTEIDRAFMEFVELKKNKLPTAEEDPRKLFLLSLLPEIKKLSDSQMRIFRRKVLDALDDALLYKPSPASTPSRSTERSYYSPSPQDTRSIPDQPLQMHDAINASQYYQGFITSESGNYEYTS